MLQSHGKLGMIA